MMLCILTSFLAHVLLVLFFQGVGELKGLETKKNEPGRD
jgi:hypothetical protein